MSYLGGNPVVQINPSGAIYDPNKMLLKDPVRVATTANITLSGTQTIDGVLLVVGDRVLVKDQTDQTQNGIYVVAAGAWARSADADANDEVVPGMQVSVREGTENLDSVWMLINDSTVTLEVTNLVFSPINGSGNNTSKRLALTGSTPTISAADLKAYGAFSWTLSANSTITLPNTSLPEAGAWYIDATVDTTGGYTVTWTNGTLMYGYYFDCLPNAKYRFWIVSRGTALDVSVERIA